MAGNAKAQIDIEVNESGVDSALDEAESAFLDFGTTVKAAMAGIGLGLLIGQLHQFSSEVLELAEVQEQAETKLAAVLRATGNAAGFTLEELKKMASEYQNLTTVGDEVQLSAQAVLATFKNIKGDNFAEAAMLMLDLSHVLDGDVKSSALQLGKALNDPIRGISALSRAGIQFTTEQRDMIQAFQESGDMASAQRVILDELSGQLGGTAAAAANTFSGRMQQLENTTGDVYEEMGFLIQEILIPFVPLMEASVGAVANFTVAAKPFAEGVAEMATEMLDFTSVIVENSDESIRWWAEMGAIFGNIHDVIAAQLLRAAAGVLDFGADVGYVFTELLPFVGRTGAEVIIQTLTQIDDMFITMGSNVLKNMTDFMSELKDVMTGGDFDFEPTNVLEGFEFKLEALPELGERKGSEMAKLFREAAEDMDMDIGEKINKAIEEAQAGRPTIEVETKVEKPPLIPPTKPKDEEKPKKKKDDKEKEDKEDDSQAGESTGLAEIFDQIQQAALGDDKEEEKQLVKAAEEQLEQAKAVEQAVKGISDALVSTSSLNTTGLAGLTSLITGLSLEPPSVNVDVETEPTEGVDTSNLESEIQKVADKVATAGDDLRLVSALHDLRSTLSEGSTDEELAGRISELLFKLQNLTSEADEETLGDLEMRIRSLESEVETPVPQTEAPSNTDPVFQTNPFFETPEWPSFDEFPETDVTVNTSIPELPPIVVPDLPKLTAEDVVEIKVPDTPGVNIEVEVEQEPVVDGLKEVVAAIQAIPVPPDPPEPGPQRFA